MPTKRRSARLITKSTTKSKEDLKGLGMPVGYMSIEDKIAYLPSGKSKNSKNSVKEYKSKSKNK